jgi:hypothetical protein
VTTETQTVPPTDTLPTDTGQETAPPDQGGDTGGAQGDEGGGLSVPEGGE